MAALRSRTRCRNWLSHLPEHRFAALSWRLFPAQQFSDDRRTGAQYRSVTRAGRETHFLGDVFPPLEISGGDRAVAMIAVLVEINEPAPPDLDRRRAFGPV